MSASQGIVTMRQFLSHGRFANNLFNYAFLKCYAHEHDCELQIPAWTGTELFGLQDPPVTVTLPPYQEKTGDGSLLSQAIPPQGNELVNRDFHGFAQYHTSFWTPDRERWWHDSFRPLPSVLEEYRIPKLNQIETWIGVHVRYTDYGRSIFYRTPLAWYRDWLESHLDSFTNPRIFFASDEPELRAEFADFHAVTAEDLGVRLSGDPMANFAYLGVDLRERKPHLMAFYADFNLLSQCNVILAGNSSFPFAAAMLGCCPRFYRSDLPSGKFVQIDPWDSYPLTHDKAEDYRHIPGVCLDETAYWKRLPDGTFEEKT